MRFQNNTTIVSMERERYNICFNYTNFVPKWVFKRKIGPLAWIMLGACPGITIKPGKK
jgi:hypothetical protein